MLASSFLGSRSRGDVPFIGFVETHPPCVTFKNCSGDDDRIANLKSIRQALASYDPEIRFIGYHFQASSLETPASIPRNRFLKNWMALGEKAGDILKAGETNLPLEVFATSKQDLAEKTF